MRPRVSLRVQFKSEPQVDIADEMRELRGVRYSRYSSHHRELGEPRRERSVRGPL